MYAHTPFLSKAGCVIHRIIEGSWSLNFLLISFFTTKVNLTHSRNSFTKPVNLSFHTKQVDEERDLFPFSFISWSHFSWLFVFHPLNNSPTFLELAHVKPSFLMTIILDIEQTFSFLLQYILHCITLTQECCWLMIDSFSSFLLVSWMAFCLMSP